MKRTVTSLLSVILALPFALAACADPVGPGAVTSGEPDAISPSNLLGLGGLLGGASMKAVKWTSGHSSGTYSVTGVIGPQGGTLSLPRSDFTITFAAGAVSSATRMTITSHSGKYVSYDMQPHGITFSAPVTVSQGLHNTEASSLLNSLKQLTGAYLDHDDPPAPDGSIRVTEILPSLTYVVRNLLGVLIPVRQTWELRHFSRYMLASG